MRLFTILFMAALTAGATYTIAPFLFFMFAGFIADAQKGTLTGGSLVMGMLFVTMTAFLGGFWGAFIYLIAPPRRPLEAGGLRLSEAGGITRVQAPNFSAWQAAFVGCVFLPFVFAFLTILVGRSMEPAMEIAIAGWVLLIAAIAFFPAIILRRRKRGDFDIVIDSTKREISLPAMNDRKERLALSFPEVEAATIEEGWEGSGRSRKFRSHVFLKAGRDSHHVAAFNSQSESAHAFREWLEYKLGLPPTSSPA